MPVLAETGQSFSNNFNAKTQRREGAERKNQKLCVVASLRLCVDFSLAEFLRFGYLKPH
jgi:hypothetical protein